MLLMCHCIKCKKEYGKDWQDDRKPEICGECRALLMESILTKELASQDAEGIKTPDLDWKRVRDLYAQRDTITSGAFMKTIQSHFESVYTTPKKFTEKEIIEWFHSACERKKLHPDEDSEYSIIEFCKENNLLLDK